MYTSEKYSVMWYKRYNTIGIREKFGNKRQVITYGSGVDLGEWAESRLREWADACLERLDKGESPANVKKWVDERIGSA